MELKLSMSRSVVSAFSGASSTYNKSGEFQAFAAHRLALSLPSLDVLAPSILEIGAGTGFVTSFLLKRYHDCFLSITDASSEMIEECKQSILEQFSGRADNLSFASQDIDGILGNDTKAISYDLVVCGMTLQWVKNPVETILALMSVVRTGGFFVFSALCDNTFREWRQILKSEGYDLQVAHIPRTGLSDIGAKLEFFSVYDDYHSGEGFINHLKKTGAYTNLSSPIPVGKLRRAIKNFDGKVTYDLVIGTIQKL